MQQNQRSIFTAPPEDIPLHRARWLISNWVMPLNAMLLFSGTIVAALDLLSPRIALLPFAAVLALALLAALIACRKLLGKGLPAKSSLRWWLAPEHSLPHSPAAVAIATMALVMTAGAVWSNSAEPRGGILASRFDVARAAQEQLGILHAVRAEQQRQTVILEDIREGRADNPRRRLAAQGMAWSGSGFGDALRRDDAPAVNLYLSGGMKWDLGLALKMRGPESAAVAAMMVAHPDAFVARDHYVCGWYFDVLATDTFNGPNESDRQFLRSACSSPKELAVLKQIIDTREKGDLGEAYRREELGRLRSMLASLT